jgi:hypothetical protein
VKLDELAVSNSATRRSRCSITPRIGPSQKGSLLTDWESFRGRISDVVRFLRTGRPFPLVRKER